MRRSDLWRAIRALRPSPVRSLVAVLLGTAALGSAIGLMGVSGWLISRAAQQPPVLYLMVAVVTVRALGIGRGVLRYSERLASHDVALRGVVTVRETLYQRLAAAEPAAAASLRRGDLLARVGADVDTLAEVVVRSLLPFGVAALTALASVGVLLVLLPASGAALAIGLLVAGMIAPALSALAARRAEHDVAATRAATSTEVMALLDGLDELTVAGVAAARLQRVRDTDARLSRETDAAARPAAAAAAVATFATGAAVLGCLWFGVRAVDAGALAPVMLAVVTLLPLAAAEAVLPLPAAAVGLVRAGAAATRVMALLDAPPAGSAAPVSTVSTAERAEALSEPVLRARGLCCGWPGAAPPVVGVDLDLTPGRRVAIVGASGEGKSTLLMTLAGLLSPVAGTLTLESEGAAARSLDEVAAPIVRRTIGFTAEHAHVFGTSVRENLRVGRPDAPDEALVAALDAADLGDWVASRPQGLDTRLRSSVGDADGVPLSGGERRRLLTARALVSATPILLLDEPAEHLDTATADHLVRAVLTSDRPECVVVVTHRLTPLDAADEVLVIGGGRVVARGTHEHLLATHRPYRSACEAEQTARSDTADTAPTAAVIA